MDERVKAFLDKKLAEEKQKQLEQNQEREIEYERFKKEVLRKAGLFEKVYAPDGQSSPSEEFPKSEWDYKTQRNKYYRLKYVEVTDEELKQINKYIKIDEEDSDQQKVNEDNMFSGNLVKKMPNSIQEILKADKVTTNLWTWAEKLERWGKGIMIFTIVIGIILSLILAIVAEDFFIFVILAVALAFGAVIEYITYHVIALLIGSLASIVQNTRVSADTSLYNTDNHSK